MGTGNQMGLPDGLVGIVPRLVRALFIGIQERSEAAEFKVSIQFLEIYNEEVKDLLEPGARSKSMSIWESTDGEIQIVGAREVVVDSSQELVDCLEAGSSSRATGETLLNAASSRSHAIFTIMLEQRVGHTGDDKTDDGNDVQEVRRAKFHLVDLAGSERTKKSGAAGDRFKESVHINQGLLCLGNVISALGDESRPRPTHVPYRDSKLTRLLQDSLGGNSRTCMIACISAADDSFDETLNTLKYANRARNIKNKPHVNREIRCSPGDLKSEAQELQLKLLRQYLDGSTLGALPELLLMDFEKGELALDDLEKLREMASRADTHGLVLSLHDRSLSELEKMVRNLQSQVDISNSETADLQVRLQDAEESKEKMQMTLIGQMQQVAAVVQEVEGLVAAGEISPQARNRLVLMCQQFTSDKKAMSSKRHICTSANGTPRDYLQQVHEGVTAGDLQNLVVKREKEIEEVRQQLREAQEHLARDEVIFANKVQEVNSLKAASRETERKLETIRHTHEQQTEQLRNELDLWKSRAEAMPSSPHPSVSGAQEAPVVLGPGQAENDGGSGGQNGDADIGLEDDVVLFDDELLSYISDTDYTDLHGSGAMQYEDDDQQNAEVHRMMVERAAIEAEKESLYAQMAAQNHEFGQVRESLSRQLQGLEKDIWEKEETIQKLRASEQDARAQSEEYLARVRDLEQEIAKKEAEVEHLRREVDSIEGNRAKTAEDKIQLRLKYDRKITQAQLQMDNLRKQVKEQQKLISEREQQRAQNQIKLLQEDLERSRAKHTSLQHKMQSKGRAFEAQRQQSQREIKDLHAAAAAANKTIAELEKENSKQTNIIKRKQDQVVAAQRRLRELALDPKVLQSYTRREAASLYKEVWAHSQLLQKDGQGAAPRDCGTTRFPRGKATARRAWERLPVEDSAKSPRPGARPLTPRNRAEPPSGNGRVQPNPFVLSSQSKPLTPREGSSRAAGLREPRAGSLQLTPRGEGTQLTPRGRSGQLTPRGDPSQWIQGRPSGERPLTPRGDRPLTPRERQLTPRGDRPLTPRDRQLTPRGDRPLTPRERQLTPRGERQLTLRGERQLTPRGERQLTSKGEGQLTPRGEVQLTPRGQAAEGPLHLKGSLGSAWMPESSRKGADVDDRMQDAPPAVNISKHVQWLDSKVDKVVKKRTAEMELQGLKKRREMVLQERDNIIKNRSLLELKHMRMENSTDRRLAELEGQMRALKQESSTLKPSAQQGDTEAARKLIISHNQLKALEKSRKSLLVSKPQDSEMELSALDDRVDILSAELEYLNDAIAERLRMVSSASLAAEGIQCCVACLSSEEAHGVLEHCLMQLVQVLQEQKHKADKIARLEAAVVDKTHQVDVAESNLKVKHKELERRLREVQREHAVKVQGLLRQIKVLSREQPLPLPGRVDGSASGRGNGGEASPGMSSCTDAEQEAAFYKQQAEQLSKDNFYYKLRNKELKQKLKGMQAEGSSGDQASTQVPLVSRMQTACSPNNLQ
eukprot:evm.model.scf_1512.1 EVM.evm.TU.scf_1512.1   scf_1512:1612-17758(+)